MVSTSSGTFVMGAWHRASSHAARKPETRRMPSDAGEMVITTDDHAAQPPFHGCGSHGSCSPALPWKRNSGSRGTFLRGRVVCSRLAAFIISASWARLDLSGIGLRKYNFEATDHRAMCIRVHSSLSPSTFSRWQTAIARIRKSGIMVRTKRFPCYSPTSGVDQESGLAVTDSMPLQICPGQPCPTIVDGRGDGTTHSNGKSVCTSHVLESDKPFILQ